METYPLPLAIFDFVLVFIFLVGTYFLVRIAMLLRGTPCSRMVMAGALMVFAGGFLKALWKFIYTTTLRDYRWMSEVQFALVAPGFFALLVAAILVARGKRATLSTIPTMAMAGWKIPLLILMTLSSMGAQGILAYLAFRRGAKLAAFGFILAFLCLVAMGGMASGVQTITRQWVEESINTLGQIGFATGSYLLHRQTLEIKGNC